MSGYKYCVVHGCENTIVKTPDKLFIHVPKSSNLLEVRKQWLQLAGRNIDEFSSKSTIYFCEDHFDLPNDMENYMQYKILGSVKTIRMKPGCVPSNLLQKQETIKWIEVPVEWDEPSGESNKNNSNTNKFIVDKCEKGTQICISTESKMTQTEPVTTVSLDKGVQVLCKQKYRSKSKRIKTTKTK